VALLVFQSGLSAPNFQLEEQPLLAAMIFPAAHVETWSEEAHKSPDVLVFCRLATIGTEPELEQFGIASIVTFHGAA
jgi:hypothetical protein